MPVVSSTKCHDFDVELPGAIARLCNRHRSHNIVPPAPLVDLLAGKCPSSTAAWWMRHHTVRRAGPFDVSHMGIVVTGSGAESFLQRMTTNDSQRCGLCRRSTRWFVTTGRHQDDISSIGWRGP